MRKKILAFVFAAALLAALAVPLFYRADSAEAAIHPIASSECAAAAGSAVANGQNPPGQLPADGPGDGHGDLQGPSNSIPNSDGESTNGNSGAANCPNA